MAVVRSVVVVVMKVEGGVGARRRRWCAERRRDNTVGAVCGRVRMEMGCAGCEGGRRGVCARRRFSREVGLDADAEEKEVEWAGGGQAQNARCAFRGGGRHVPCFRALQTGWQLARGSISSLGQATRAADGNKKVGLFSLRVAGCSVLFF